MALLIRRGETISIGSRNRPSRRVVFSSQSLLTHNFTQHTSSREQRATLHRAETELVAKIANNFSLSHVESSRRYRSELHSIAQVTTLQYRLEKV